MQTGKRRTARMRVRPERTNSRVRFGVGTVVGRRPARAEGNARHHFGRALMETDPALRAGAAARCRASTINARIDPLCCQQTARHSERVATAQVV